MAHPKRKISKTRRDKRRTHYKAKAPTLAKDPATCQSKQPERCGTEHEPSAPIGTGRVRANPSA